MNNESKQSNLFNSAKEQGKRFLKELQLQGPCYDRMGESFMARFSKHRLE